MGVFVDSPLGSGDAHQSEHLRRPVKGFRFVHSLMGHIRFRDLVSDRVNRVQRGHGLLEDHGDVFAPDLPHGRRRKLEEVPALEFDGPSRIFPGGSGMRRMIVRAVTDFPQPDSPKTPGFGPVDPEGDPVHGLHHPLGGEEMSGHILQRIRGSFKAGPFRRRDKRRDGPVRSRPGEDRSGGNPPPFWGSGCESGIPRAD